MIKNLVLILCLAMWANIAAAEISVQDNVVASDNTANEDKNLTTTDEGTTEVITVKTEPKNFQPSPEMQAALKKSMLGEVSDGLTLGERVWKYVKSGFIHIIPEGLDHILFVLGLFFSTVIFSQLIWQVTAFTLAHTVTLALASLGVVSIGAQIVEPLIALSIFYIAVENIRSEQQSKSKLPLIFAFGLLHGLGFAFVLGEFGLPSDALISSLLSFNIGVELGQLTVIAAAMVLFYRWSKLPSYRMFVQIPGSLVIGGFGLFWFVERII